MPSVSTLFIVLLSFVYPDLISRAENVLAKPDEDFSLKKKSVQPEVDSRSSAEIEEYTPELNTSFTGFVTLLVASFNTSDATLHVTDTAARSWDGRLIIQRLIINPVRRDLYLSQAFLLTPLHYNETLNTTTLPINKAVMGGYWALLASPPFVSGSLDTQRNATGDVVVIGLGAGQLNNYLHYHFPKLDITAVEIQPAFGIIAKKYFGFTEDATQRLYITDGIKFLAEAASEGRKYNAIYIDACPSVYRFGAEVLCPAEAFLNSTNIQNMKQALSRTGTIVVKMLLMSKNVTDKALKLSEPYRHIFGSCVVLPMVISPYNRMLICAGDPSKKLDAEWLWNEILTFRAPDF